MASISSIALVAATIAALAPCGVRAQSVLTGVVRDAATSHAIAGAEVLVRELKLAARTDSEGRFRVHGLVAGRYPIVTRNVGYDSISVTLTFGGADSSAHDFLMTMHAQPLPEVPVRREGATLGNAKMAIFERRRERGIGHFLTEADFAKDLSRLTANILSRLPGVKIVRSRRNQAACVGTTRGTQSFIGTAVVGCWGSVIACPAAVFLDGALVYGGMPGEEAFDVNSLQPSEIAGVEFYAGPAQMPVELNATRTTCGALVIWTK